MAIPLFDLATPVAPLRASIDARIAAVLDRRSYVLGPELQGFEQNFADYLGVRNVIGVGNGTDAITIALRSLGVEPGDDVVVPSFTFYASVEAIITAGARPVFCDVDLATRNVTVDTVKAALTPRSTAIVAVDLFGLPAPVVELREAFGLPVLEDAAQAAGSRQDGRRAGSLGDAATFSFYPSKNLGCFGDGGAIATDDDDVAEFARTLRFHGSKDKKTFEYVGYNSRLDELQAAILDTLLPHLDGWCDARRAATRAYADAGLGEIVGLPAVPVGADPAWHLFVVRHDEPDALVDALVAAGIQTRIYYRTPVHRQQGMAPYVDRQLVLPATEELGRTNLALPMNPAVTPDDVAEVVDVLARAGGLGTGAARTGAASTAGSASRAGTPR
jgi:dTDP-4-amino-4,6-dideoxygalactose transaminase